MIDDLDAEISHYQQELEKVQRQIEKLNQLVLALET